MCKFYTAVETFIRIAFFFWPAFEFVFFLTILELCFKLMLQIHNSSKIYESSSRAIPTLPLSFYCSLQQKLFLSKF